MLSQASLKLILSVSEGGVAKKPISFFNFLIKLKILQLGGNRGTVPPCVR